MEEKYTELRVGEEVRRYQVVCGYQEHEQLRKSFNELTGKVFGFSLEEWYQNGFWNGRYIPYSLVDHDRVVANISVNILDYLVFSEKKRYIQLGTVMTHPDFRGHGLNRHLMELVLEEWEDHCDLFYLYANDSVVDFYPKFGFVEAEEQVYSRPFRKHPEKEVPLPRKLDMDDPEDREFLFDSIAGSMVHSKVAMVDNPGLQMFHCMADQRDNIYHFEQQDVIAIASIGGKTLHLHDVFASDVFVMDEILEALADEHTRTLRMGFVPRQPHNWKKEARDEEEETFFVREGKGKLPEGVMFPELSHA
ncbi:MAG TPA: GNAT family N-acetyltransferase [Clostridiaceae bacterium]|nr:GNAT family N-acetyltransferase [Clostridiaceae bacterium]